MSQLSSIRRSVGSVGICGFSGSFPVSRVGSLDFTGARRLSRLLSVGGVYLGSGVACEV